MQRRHLLTAAWGLCATAHSQAAAPSGLAPGGVATQPDRGNAAIPGLRRQSSGLHWRTRALLALGTTVRLHAGGTDVSRLTLALDAAVQGLRAVEASMSLFRADSELSRLNREGQLSNPSAHLLTVLRQAEAVARRSQGAFDITVQPLWLAFERARLAGRLPNAAERAEAQARVGWQQVQVSDAGVRLARPGMALTLNGIAQGYAADVARAVLQAHGIEHALLDAGEFSSLGRNEQGQVWSLGIEDPRRAEHLLATWRSDGRCLATSADQRGAFTTDFRHHHIFDPARGDSPGELSSVSVAAPSAMLADALTKVMFVAGPQRIPTLAAQWQVGVLWVDKRGRWSATQDMPVQPAA